MDAVGSAAREATLRAVIEAVPMPAAAWRDGRLVLANRRLADLTGVARPEDLVGRPIGDLVARSREEEFHAATRASERGSPGTARFETLARTLAGAEVPLDVEVTRVEGEGGPALLGFFQDATGRKRVESARQVEATRSKLLLELYSRSQELSEEEIYRLALDAAVSLTESTVGYLHLVSEDERTIHLTCWNARALESCAAPKQGHYPIENAGIWADSLRQRKPVIHDDYRGVAEKRGLPEGHVSVDRHLGFPVVREGKVRLIFGVGNKATSYGDADVQQLQLIAGELNKIIDRRAAEAKLRKLSLAVDQSPLEVFITNPEGVIEYVNPKFTQVTGWTLDEVRGKTPRILKSGHHDPAFYEQLWSTVLGGETWHGHVVNRKKDGEVFTEDAFIAPVRDERNAVAGFVRLARDVTAELRLEEQFRQSQKMEALGQLAGGVAHDFNNVLTAIVMQLDLLQTESELTPTVQEAVSELRGDARRAADLTRQLLLFSRRKTFVSARHDLNEIVLHLLKMLERLLGEHVELLFRPHGARAWIEGDASMLEQTVLNLCINARDAMASGGRLTIETDLVEARAPGGGGAPGRFVCLRVSDTGCGMDAATLARLFEPFFTTKPRGQGTGLGLATVQGIVKQHGGWVDVESQRNVGSTFRVFLPAGQVATPSGRVAVPDKARGGSETILLVEDDAGIRKLTRACLQRFGYRVLEAEDGLQALHRWDEADGKVDLLFTDMVMPGGMTGLELCARLRERRPDLRTIVASGYTDDKLGAPDPGRGITYLTKPYDLKKLGVVVRKCLDGKPASGE